MFKKTPITKTLDTRHNEASEVADRARRQAESAVRNYELAVALHDEVAVDAQTQIDALYEQQSVAESAALDAEEAAAALRRVIA